MQQNSANTFSEDDYHPLKVRQLGEPLAIYRIKPGYIRLIRSMGQVMVLLASILLVIGVITFSLVGWHFTMSTTYPISFIFLGLTCLIMGFAFFTLPFLKIKANE